MKEQLQILMLEDMAEDAELVTHELRQSRIPFVSKRVWTREDFLREITTSANDIILADYSLPKFNAIDALALRRKHCPDVPFILVTGTLTEETAIICMQEGADDYILKKSLKRLPTAIRNAIKRRELEQKRIAAEIRLHALEGMEQTRELLTGMIIHDLRNPLSAVMGYVQLMEHKAQKIDDQMKEYLQRAFNSCLRLLEMINQLVDIERMEDRKLALNIKRHDAATLVEAKAKQYHGAASANGLRLRTQLPGTQVFLDMDEPLVGRLIENLITNAIKHTPSGGEVVLGIDAAAPQRGRVTLWVKDTGEGIPPEFHEVMFQKYGQAEIRQKMGRSYDTGLGLVFCRMVTDLHGGTIRVESAVDKGSTFFVELPAAK